MTYTKLIERLRDNTARHDDESRRLCNEAAEAIEALQAKNERLKAGLEHVKNAFGLQMQTLQSQLDAMGNGEPVATVQQYGEGVEAHLHNFLPIGTKLYAAPKALVPSREVIGRYMADKGYYLSKETLDGLMLKLEGIGGTP